MKLTYLTENLQTKTPHLIKTIQKQRKEYSEEQTQQLINYANMADPTGGKATYTPWIIKQELKGNIRLPEDITKINEYLAKYDKFKKLTNFEGNKDINQYQNFNDLADDVDKLEGLSSKREQIKDLKVSGSKVVYDDGSVKIIKLLTPEAATQYAKNTRWCTSKTEIAKDYLENNGLFVLFVGDEKFQFTRDLAQFMDVKDRPAQFDFDDYVKLYDILKSSKIIDVKYLNNFHENLNINSINVINLIKLIENGYMRFGDIAENPTILSLLDPWLIKLEPYILKDAKSAYLYTKNVIGSRWSDAEEIIMKDPRYAYRYAYHVIKGRWPEAEPYIMKNPETAYKYAHDIIQSRWPEAEPYIMVSSHFACEYAMNIIKGRWPEAEPYIMKNIPAAYNYARYIIKGRWPEAELHILEDPNYAYNYARYIIQNRWPEAEPIIMKNPTYAYNYANNVISGRWPEAESILVKNANFAYYYARDVIQNRWPEAEPTIMKNPYYAYYYARDVIGGRWPEAEPTIMGDPEYAHYYLTDVVKSKDEIQQLKKEYNL